MNLEKQVLKVLPDFFFNYYLDLDIKKEEKEKVSFINKSNIKAIKRILNAYYKNRKGDKYELKRTHKKN